MDRRISTGFDRRQWIVLVAAGLLLASAGRSYGEADEIILVAPNGRTRANAWTEMSVPPPADPASAPMLVDVVDPWGSAVWTGLAEGKTCRFFTRAWADGVYKIRFGKGQEQQFRVDTEYFDGIRARAGLMLRAIDARRDADGLPPKNWRGASNLLQRIITLHLWRAPKEVVERHMTFCERQLGFRTATATARMLGTGAANVPGFPGPYRPLARERNMMFMPPDAVFDFADHAIRKLQRWGYKPKDIEHVFISHSHADHFDAPAITLFARQRQEAGLSPLKVHAGRSACEALRTHLRQNGAEQLVVVGELRPGSETRAGELRVKAVRATHAEDASPLCFIVHWRGATVYYGTDTGYPKAETCAALAAEKFDVFAHEMTAASGDDGNVHMDLGDYQLLVGKLRAAGAIGTWTRVLSMHQSPEGPQILPDYHFFEHTIGFECGYDGMPLPIAYRVEEKP